MQLNRVLIFIFNVLLIALFTQQSTAQTICSNQTGINGSYYYTFWSNGVGSVCMTLGASGDPLGSKGNYSVNWNDATDFTCGKGWSTGISTRTLNYFGTFNPSGNAYLTVYGWTRNPLIEYYIVESYGTYQPPGTSSSGTISSDGGTYNIYRTQQVDQPSIDGTKTFYQYWSVRTSKRTMGTITIQNHVNAWASKGWNLGAYDYQILATKGYQSSGNSNVTVGGGSPSGGSSSSSSSGGGVTLSVSTSSISLGYSMNSSQQFTITSNTNWTVSSDKYWLGVNPTSGSYNASVKVSAKYDNGTTPRTATVTVSAAGVSSKTIAVTQIAGPSSSSSSSGCSSCLYTIVVRARGTNGDESVRLSHSGYEIAAWTMSTSYANYSVKTNYTDDIRVHFTNDGTNRDVQVDYITVNGSVRQAENQATNTGVRQNNKCGGSYSEWLNCNGYISFGNISKSGEQEQSKPIIPADFTLGQNYPNPFNPSTIITFEIPVNSYVSLKVYNSLGQVVAELGGREYSAGQHSVTFNASNLASGIYYYAMKAGEFCMVQKMILQK
jgi:hypothetical protein